MFYVILLLSSVAGSDPKDPELNGIPDPYNFIKVLEKFKKKKSRLLNGEKISR